MEAAREPVGRREASQVSWKPAISIAVTSALFFDAKRIPPASPIRWPFVPTGGCVHPRSASSRLYSRLSSGMLLSFLKYLGVPEELQKWFWRLFTHLERHPSPN